MGCDRRVQHCSHCFDFAAASVTDEMYFRVCSSTNEAVELVIVTVS